MRYVNSAIAAYADALEMIRARRAYARKSDECLTTYAKLELVSAETDSLLQHAVDKLAANAIPLDRETFRTAVHEISQRKRDRKRLIAYQRQQKAFQRVTAFA